MLHGVKGDLLLFTLLTARSIFSLKKDFRFSFRCTKIHIHIPLFCINIWSFQDKQASTHIARQVQLSDDCGQEQIQCCFVPVFIWLKVCRQNEKHLQSRHTRNAQVQYVLNSRCTRFMNSLCYFKCYNNIQSCIHCSCILTFFMPQGVMVTYYLHTTMIVITGSHGKRTAKGSKGRQEDLIWDMIH